MIAFASIRPDPMSWLIYMLALPGLYLVLGLASGALVYLLFRFDRRPVHDRLDLDDWAALILAWPIVWVAVVEEVKKELRKRKERVDRFSPGPRQHPDTPPPIEEPPYPHNQDERRAEGHF